MSDDSEPDVEEGPAEAPAGQTAVIPSTQALETALAAGSAPAGSALSPGAVLFGEYEIVGLLGCGGMGEVYRARHRRLDEARAIKVIRPALVSGEGTEEMFHRESKALLSIRHPAVVHCHDLLSDDGGDLYLVMELVEGITLAERMLAGPLADDELSALAARLSAGLSAAHAEGVVHRDLCPDNVILPLGLVGQAKIIDFGVAKHFGAKGPGTLVDGFKGKLAYASPEQLGFHGGVIDARSDSYSLGLVLCAAAAGQPLKMGRNVVEAVDARRTLCDVPEQVPPGLRHAVGKLLELDPAGRWDADDFIDATRGELPGSSNQSTRTPWLVVGVATAAAMVGLVALQPSRPAYETPVVEIPVVEPATDPASDPDRPDRLDRPNRADSLREKLQVAGLLRGAQAALDDGRWLRPPGTSAIDRLRAVLAVDPTNAEAKAGLAQLTSRLVRRAQTAFDSGRIEEARDDLHAAASLAPEDSEVAMLQRLMADR